MKKRKVSRSDDSNSKGIEVKSEGKKVRMIDEFYDGNRCEYSLLTTTTAKRFADELTKWAKEDENAIALTQYVAKLGVAMSTFYGWLEKSPELKRAVAIAKVHIAARREHGAMTHKFSPGPTMMMMPFYDEEHRKIVEWKSNLTQKQGDREGGDRFIVLDKWPDAGVPSRKKDEE